MKKNSEISTSLRDKSDGAIMYIDVEYTFDPNSDGWLIISVKTLRGDDITYTLDRDDHYKLQNDINQAEDELAMYEPEPDYDCDYYQPLDPTDSPRRITKHWEEND